MLNQEFSEKDIVRLPKISHKSKSVPGNTRTTHNH